MYISFRRKCTIIDKITQMVVTFSHGLFQYHIKPKEALPITLITERCYLRNKRLIVFLKLVRKKKYPENKHPSIFLEINIHI